MQLLYYSLALYLSLASADPAPAKASDKPRLPCTIRSPTSGAFFDVNPLHILDPATSKAKHPRPNSWNTTGADYGYNFTMNFCGPVIEPIEDVVGVEKNLWRNVSAYYKKEGKVYSIGQMNTEPVLRGRKLVLNYTDGSPCDAPERKREAYKRAILDDDDEKDDKKKGKGKGKHDDDDEDDDEDEKKSKVKKPSSSPLRRKETIISLLCEKDPLSPLLTLSFVGASTDECTYFFEARSPAGCGGIDKAKQTLNPSGVFGVIAMIAIIVYVVGGCVYSRMVLQQRGWRQIPNYALWSGIYGFVKDIVIILTSSCARFLPSRRGYSRVNGNIGASGAGGRGRDNEAANGLIDSYNEEWDD